MELYYTIVFALIGLVCGSFFNVVGMRWPKGESIVRPGSHCESCQTPLTARDLVPVFSYLFLRGKCRTCGATYGPFHVIIEALTSILFAYAYAQLGFSKELVVALLLISLLAIITVSDLLYTIIQDRVLLIFGTLIAIMRIISPLQPWWDAILGAAFGFSLLLLLSILSKGGMGGGDIKLYFVLGLVLGLKLTFLSLFFAALIGLIVSIILRRGFGKTIPFGPSIAVATFIVYFHGEAIFNWYLHLFT
ncbi:prepilin peptidase [Kurthia gibsonii]|uniref:prepilin peptidase n=1 Tax=Kurthia gibsonii TaxID=33946 RepID=UPI0031B6F633